MSCHVCATSSACLVKQSLGRHNGNTSGTAVGRPRSLQGNQVGALHPQGIVYGITDCWQPGLCVNAGDMSPRCDPTLSWNMPSGRGPRDTSVTHGMPKANLGGGVAHVKGAVHHQLPLPDQASNPLLEYVEERGRTVIRAFADPLNILSPTAGKYRAAVSDGRLSNDGASRSCSTSCSNSSPTEVMPRVVRRTVVTPRHLTLKTARGAGGLNTKHEEGHQPE